jgi:hypothetical protein
MRGGPEERDSSALPSNSPPNPLYEVTEAWAFDPGFCGIKTIKDWQRRSKGGEGLCSYPFPRIYSNLKVPKSSK